MWLFGLKDDTGNFKYSMDILLEFYSMFRRSGDMCTAELQAARIHIRRDQENASRSFNRKHGTKDTPTTKGTPTSSIGATRGAEAKVEKLQILNWKGFSARKFDVNRSYKVNFNDIGIPGEILQVWHDSVEFDEESGLLVHENKSETGGESLDEEEFLNDEDDDDEDDDEEEDEDEDSSFNVRVASVNHVAVTPEKSQKSSVASEATKKRPINESSVASEESKKRPINKSSVASEESKKKTNQQIFRCI